MPSQVDVLLICALKDEFDQILQVSDGLIEPGWQHETSPQGWTLAKGSFESVTDEPLTICTSWAPHMGRENALALASVLLQDIPAKCVAMSGICGGQRGKVALGDVILADRLWSYDSGKIVAQDGEKKFLGDINQVNPPPIWVQRMQNVSVSESEEWLKLRPELTLEYQEQWAIMTMTEGHTPHQHQDFSRYCPDWKNVVSRLKKREWVDGEIKLSNSGRKEAEALARDYPTGLPTPAPFAIHVAPIATGAAVIEDDHFFENLKGSMRKTLGVEMEASAIGTFAGFNTIPAIVAKGVSDCGDPLKDDRYREFAARASAEVLISLLRQSKDLLQPPASRTPPVASGSEVPVDLIEILAEEYPDTRDARSVWERAGGRKGEVENNPRPKDLWQRLWNKSIQGASVTPKKLLQAALDDLPNNPTLLKHLNN
ncbi:phosphorylase [Pseudodesulfovibrio sp. JC047]|uniref:phosphorylase family protein n=1 Tax=Pseudodesulfovibrio sp. JC047 TaxID=2683199 RepID=UPI0013D5A9B0|nr:effector-associated domain EAD1-containing protein [Pseudodesulfovibrio sp. JC047]NDV17803.1 phosphorylase [Pseudodesulfovibrio sp. JC047]